MNAFPVGLLLGLSSIIAIGAQNLFLIRQGIMKQNIAIAVITCFLCDSLLMIIGVSSVGILLMKMPMVKHIMLVFAIAFLGYYGASCFYRAYRGEVHTLSDEEKKKNSARKVLLLSLSFSLLNPHAMIDTFVIIGGSANQFTGIDKWYFLLGSMTSSLIWFSVLTFVASTFSSLLLRPRIFRSLEAGSGVLMWSIIVVLLNKI